MKIKVVIGIIIAAVIAIVGVSKLLSGATDQNRDEAKDSLKFKTIEVRDSVNNEALRLVAHAVVNVQYPENAEADLLALWKHTVLDAVDSVAMDAAVSNLLKTELTNNDEGDSAVEIRNHCYEGSGILTTTRSEKICSDDNRFEIAVVHHYNFDMEKCQRITLSRLFKEGVRGKITALLKEQLMKTLEVADESALMAIGYYNIDHLVANENFLIQEDGIMWTYNPLEIACYKAGVTEVKLSYEQLGEYLLPGLNVIKKSKDKRWK